MQVRLIEGLASGRFVDVPRLDDTILVTDHDRLTNYGAHPSDHQLRYRLAFSGDEPVYMFDCSVMPAEADDPE